MHVIQQRSRRRVGPVVPGVQLNELVGGDQPTLPKGIASLLGWETRPEEASRGGPPEMVQACRDGLKRLVHGERHDGNVAERWLNLSPVCERMAAVTSSEAE